MDAFTTQVKVWGNSKALRLNKEILTALGITANDEVEMAVQNHQLIVTPKHKMTLKEKMAKQ
jgi:antitoxin component of MazEF toxin-antitoxin module